MPGTLILTVTRACNLRCSYCPTAKDGWPSLSVPDVTRAIQLFTEQLGGGDIKLFGGEPLLAPGAVHAALDAADANPSIRRVYLSTNGLGLNAAWLARLKASPKAVLTISMDGRPDDHRRMRRALPGVPDAYSHILALRADLLATPRVVITQTIAPATARYAAQNFDHLRSLGFRRFNLLPGYYLPWRPEQLTDLHQGFTQIGDRFRAGWRAGERLYLRNLFTRAPTPFFNTGMVVDADRTIHPSNIGLSAALDGLREHTIVGTLDAPPTPQALEDAAKRVPQLLEGAVAPAVLESTRAVDAELTQLCRSLYRPFFASRARARATSITPKPSPKINSLPG